MKINREKFETGVWIILSSIACLVIGFWVGVTVALPLWGHEPDFVVQQNAVWGCLAMTLIVLMPVAGFVFLCDAVILRYPPIIGAGFEAMAVPCDSAFLGPIFNCV